MSKEAIKLMLHEMEYVLDCINNHVVPFDGDDFHEALRLGRKSIAEADKQEPVAKITAHRAAYFMERFKREEKLLGPNEQAAVDFVIAMLENYPQPKQEQGEPVATIRTWHKMGEQHAELWNWHDGLENLPDGSHDVYTHPPVPTAQPDLERIADDLQELCDKQALRIGALEAQLAKPKQEPVNVFVEWLKTRQNDSYSCGVLVRDALEKLEAQPKEPAVPQGHKQEPVWTIDSLEQAIYENTKEFVPLNVMEWLLNRLNTSPPQRKPLTYVDLRRIANQCGLGASEVSAQAQAKVDTFARAIEAAHGITASEAEDSAKE